MGNPFRDPNLMVRTMAFSAAIFGISLGLCGLNLGAASLIHSQGGMPPLLVTTGLCEIGGMAIGAAGMVLSAAGLLIKLIVGLASRKA